MKKILIVDDEINIANALKRALLDKYDVEIEINPIEAYEKIKSDGDGINLVMSDIRMPRMTGIELKLKLNNENINVPVILMSANHEYETECNELGGYFLKKPWSNKDLYKIIEDILK